MTFATIKHSQRLLVFIGVALAVVILVSILYIRPTLDALATTIETINDRRAEQAALEKPAPATDRDLETVTKDLARVAGTTIETSQALEFISRFERLASESGVTATMSLGEFDPAATSLQEITVQVQVKSSYSNLIRFLQQLNADPAYLVFTGLTIRPLSEATTSADGPSVETTLSGLTYWRTTP